MKTISREEIRKKHAELTADLVEMNGYISDQLIRKFHELKASCTHPLGAYNGDIDLWACPDCGLRR